MKRFGKGEIRDQPILFHTVIEYMAEESWLDENIGTFDHKQLLCTQGESPSYTVERTWLLLEICADNHYEVTKLYTSDQRESTCTHTAESMK